MSNFFISMGCLVKQVGHGAPAVWLWHDCILYTILCLLLRCSETHNESEVIVICPISLLLAAISLDSLMKIYKYLNTHSQVLANPCFHWEVDILSQRLYYISYWCLWCYHMSLVTLCLLSWHKAKLVSVNSSEVCTHQSWWPGL